MSQPLFASHCLVYLHIPLLTSQLRFPTAPHQQYRSDAPNPIDTFRAATHGCCVQIMLSTCKCCTICYTGCYLMPITGVEPVLTAKAVVLPNTTSTSYAARCQCCSQCHHLCYITAPRTNAPACNYAHAQFTTQPCVDYSKELKRLDRIVFREK